MPNLLKLLIPLALGIVAAGINYSILSSSTKPSTFLTVKEQVSINSEFDVDNLVPLEIPFDAAAGLKKVAIEYKDRAAIFRQLATRDVYPGDVLLYRDSNFDSAPSYDLRSPTEEVIAVPVSNRDIIGARIGDYLNFIIPENLENPSLTETQEIGPFRIVAIGEQTNIDAQEYNYRSNNVFVAIDKKDAKRQQREQQLEKFLIATKNNNRQAPRVLGTYIEQAKY